MLRLVEELAALRLAFTEGPGYLQVLHLATDFEALENVAGGQLEFFLLGFDVFLFGRFRFGRRDGARVAFESFSVEEERISLIQAYS